MKKKYLSLLYLFISFLIFSKAFINPFWSKGIRYNPIPGIMPALFSEPQFISNFSVPVDYANGIYFSVFYQLDAEVRFSKLFNFYSTLKLGINIPYGINIPSMIKTPLVNSSSFSWIMYPIPYLKIFINYKFRNFSQYKIFEHNLSFAASFLIDFKRMPKWLDIEFLNGFNIRFVDLDIRSNNVKYKSDWLLEIFIIFQMKIMFHPAFCYSLGFSYGNYDEFIVNTANYWQMEFYNYFHIMKDFSLFLNVGFSTSGAYGLSAIINRAWGEIGARYAFKEY